MKDSMESTLVRRAPESEEFSNRKLIRPSLARAENNRVEAPGERAERPPAPAKKALPPEQTHAENFYYQKQMQAKTPMVVVMADGEQIHGVIEWYDRSCIKITRTSGPNLLIYKPNIKYLFKESENERR